MRNPFSLRQAIGAIALAAWLAALSPLAANDAPQRIVSVNMCADQLLLALADPQQIAALSWNATRRLLSFYAAKGANRTHAGRPRTPSSASRTSSLRAVCRRA
ncbi:MAG: hypothetical protein R3D43_00470 [Tepidamorphaceae bacterium]